MPTDTEMLDWIINGLIDDPSDDYTAKLTGALLMGAKGRDAIAMAMEDRVPAGVIQASIKLARS